MKRTISTKYCHIDSKQDVNYFEKKFEEYVERKVKKILSNPKKYPLVTVINGESYEND